MHVVCYERTRSSFPVAEGIALLTYYTLQDLLAAYNQNIVFSHGEYYDDSAMQ